MNIEEIRDHCFNKPGEQHPEVTPAWHFNKVVVELFYTLKIANPEHWGYPA